MKRKSCKLPNTVKNDHADNYLYKIILSVNSLTMKQFQSNIRSGPYLVSDDIISYKLEFSGKNPIVVDWASMICPLDIPLLPENWLIDGIPENQKIITYTDERSNELYTQKIEPFESIIKENNTPFIHLSINNKVGNHIMLFEEGYPWWIEWRNINNDGSIKGLWFSRMIEWKK